MNPIEQISDRLNKTFTDVAEGKLTRDILTKMCFDMISKDDSRKPQARMVFPVEEPRGTKKNRVRLIPEDRTSPMGNILKHEQVDAIKTAAASFDAYHVLAWLYSLPE